MCVERAGTKPLGSRFGGCMCGRVWGNHLNRLRHIALGFLFVSD